MSLSWLGFQCASAANCFGDSAKRFPIVTRCLPSVAAHLVKVTVIAAHPDLNHSGGHQHLPSYISFFEHLDFHSVAPVLGLHLAALTAIVLLIPKKLC